MSWSTFQPVLDGLDDREKNPEIPLPDEHPVEYGSIVVRRKFVERARVVREKNDGDRRPRLSRLAREIERGHVLEPSEVMTRSNRFSVWIIESASPPLDTRVMLGAIGEVQPHVLRDERLVETAVLGEDERVVDARREQDVVDLVAEKVLEPLETVPVPVLEIVEVEFLVGHCFRPRSFRVRRGSCGGVCVRRRPSVANNAAVDGRRSRSIETADGGSRTGRRTRSFRRRVGDLFETRQSGATSTIIENGVEIFHPVFTVQRVQRPLHDAHGPSSRRPP